MCIGPTVYELNVESDVNMKFNSFADISYHCCDTAYLVKVEYLNGSHIKNWVTQGSRNSSKKMHVLVNQKQRHMCQCKI